MPGLLDVLFGNDTQTIDQIRPHTGNDPQKAEQAYSAAAGTILRGLEDKAQTQDGAQNVWDMIRKAVEKGNVPAGAPTQSGGVQVRDMDPKTVNDMMKVIFGANAPDVQNAYGKVITLDPETSKKVFAKVLPAVLGSIFGAAEQAPEESHQALPRILGDARDEIDQRQPNAANVFSAILDRDHDGDVDLDDLAGIFMNKPR